MLVARLILDAVSCRYMRNTSSIKINSSSDSVLIWKKGSPGEATSNATYNTWWFIICQEVKYTGICYNGTAEEKLVSLSYDGIVDTSSDIIIGTKKRSWSRPVFSLRLPSTSLTLQFTNAASIAPGSTFLVRFTKFLFLASLCYSV